MNFIEFLGRFFLTLIYSIAKKFTRRPRKSIKGEIALITGGGHGLGRSLAIKMASLGATTVVVDINEENNHETAKIIREAGGKAYDYTCDLAKLENIQRLGKRVREEVGDVTILVNNAAVVHVTNFLKRSDDKIVNTFNVNILSHFRTIKEFLPAMIRNNHGHILAISSQAGLFGVGYLPVYCATKHGIMGLMESLRRELRWEGVKGVKTTVGCPNWINTGFAKNPTSGSYWLSPILTTDYVADEFLKALLADEPQIELPSASSMFALKAFFPDAAVELLVDYIKPLCDHTN